MPCMVLCVCRSIKNVAHCHEVKQGNNYAQREKRWYCRDNPDRPSYLFTLCCCSSTSFFLGGGEYRKDKKLWGKKRTFLSSLVYVWFLFWCCSSSHSSGSFSFQLSFCFVVESVAGSRYISADWLDEWIAFSVFRIKKKNKRKWWQQQRTVVWIAE